MAGRNLFLSVSEYRAKTPPNRGLELRCKIENPSSLDICILGTWLWIEAFNQSNIAEGSLFYSMNNLVDPAVIPAGKAGLGAIVIPLPSNVMSLLEEKRAGAGGDLPLKIFSKVMIAQTFPITKGGATVLGPPMEAQFEHMGSSSIEHIIPESEWIKILKGLGWSELELLEIPTAKLSALPAFAHASKRLSDAQSCYRRGEWEETIINCRKVFESVIKDVTKEDNLKNATKAFSSILGEGPKADCVNELVQSLTKLLHLARHEQRPVVHMKLAEARLALHLTGAILAYLGSGG